MFAESYTPSPYYEQEPPQQLYPTAVTFEDLQHLKVYNLHNQPSSVVRLLPDRDQSANQLNLIPKLQLKSSMSGGLGTSRGTSSSKSAGGLAHSESDASMASTAASDLMAHHTNGESSSASMSFGDVSAETASLSSTTFGDAMMVSSEGLLMADEKLMVQ